MNEAKELYELLRNNAIYSVGVTIPVPIYERLKLYLQNKSKDNGQ